MGHGAGSDIFQQRHSITAVDADVAEAEDALENAEVDRTFALALVFALRPATGAAINAKTKTSCPN